MTRGRYALTVLVVLTLCTAGASAAVAASQPGSQTVHADETAAAVSTAASLTYGETVSSELDSSDPYDESQGGYHEEYTFYGEEGDTISIEMRPEGSNGHATDEHAARVKLYGPNGDRVVRTFSTSGTAQIERRTLEEDGQYTIVATTYDLFGLYDDPPEAYDDETEARTDTFGYQLRLYEGVGDKQQISPGTTLTGEIEQSDNYQESLTGYYDVYSFNATSGQRISAEARVNDPEADTPEVRLFAPDGTEVFTSRDDGGMAQLERHQVDQTGEFDLVVTTREAGYDDAETARTATPRYRLRLYEDVGNRTLLEYGDTVTGRLSPQDNYLDELAGYYDAYTLSASEGDAITASVSVDDPEGNAAQVILLAPDGSTATTTHTDSGGATLSDYSVGQTGVYTVVVTSEPGASVYDSTDAGKADRFRYQLTVDGPDNNPPIVTAGSEPETAAVGEFVTLTATANDPNGDSLSYEWEQIIGAFPDPEVTLQLADSATPTFTAPAVEASTRLDFEVTVSDGNGGTVTKETAVTVDPSLSPPPEPAEPAASFTVSPTAPSTGTEVTFDASGSTDPDGTIVTYRWDFDGDGSYETTGETATHEFSSEGNASVTLQIVSSSGASNTTTQTVDVSASEPSVEPIVGNAPPTDVDGDGEYEDINGDGTVDIVDVSAFFEHYADDVVQNQDTAAFDFTNDGAIDIADVNRLFEMVA